MWSAGLREGVGRHPFLPFDRRPFGSMYTREPVRVDKKDIDRRLTPAIVNGCLYLE